MEKQLGPKEIEKKKLLAVEGKDEVIFFNELFKHIGMDGIVDVLEVGGKDQFKNRIPALKKTPGFNNLEAIAIIRDADNSAKDAFKSIIGILEKNKLQPPENPGEFSQENLKVGVFIMPDNSRKGMLEDICLDTVKNREEIKCVDQFIECAKQLKTPPAKTELSKAKVQAFLAIHPKVPDSVGRGAQRKHWDFDSPALAPLKKFLSQLK